ncbi:MAG: hypothetical protein FWE23_04675 [Chitinivibrionia bacterium]|nr:hypothetical protein [Chitinivibrionia bacterium]
MTDEEADYWDELFTRTTPEVSKSGKPGFFIRNKNKTLVFQNPDDTITIVPPRVNDTTTLITFDPKNLASITTKTHTTKLSAIKTAKKRAKKELALA